MDPALWELLEAGNQSDEVAAIVRLEQPRVIPEGVRVISQFDNIVTCRLRRGSILEVWADETVASVKASRFLTPEPTVDIDLQEVLSESGRWVDTRRPPNIPETGQGVVIGVVDWGFDFAHPDFLNPDGSTRILALWDQRSRPYQVPPQPYGYGVVYTQAEINRALQTSDSYKTLGYHPAEVDPKGEGTHGTHVASIAGGNGGSGGPVGVAPKASFVFVHMGTVASQKRDNLGNSVALLEAIDFIAKTAGNRPWVINLSMGRHGEQHDGTTLVEQGLDAAVSRVPGCAIIQSAGNYYDRRIHTQGQIRPGESHSFTWHVDAADVTPNQLEVWYSGKDTFEVELRSPDRTLFATAPLGERVPLKQGDRVIGKLYHRRHEPNNQDHQIQIFLYTSAPPGDWQVTLIAKDVVDGRFHAWIERDVALPGCQSHFDVEDAVNNCTTGTICNGFRTIAVGAYDLHSPNWEIARFSSSGPIRDGREKPDIVAPGVAILAARSAPRSHEDSPQLLTRKSGTSMAAPHVAGTVALMFEAAEQPLEIADTRRLLLGNAQKPGADADHTRFGNGYLDIEAAVNAARQFSKQPAQLRMHSQRPAPQRSMTEVFGMYTDVSGIEDAVIDAIEQLDESTSSSECCGEPHQKDYSTAFRETFAELTEQSNLESYWADDLDNDWNELTDDGIVPDDECDSGESEIAHRLIDFAESILHAPLDDAATLAPGDLWAEIVAKVGVQAEFAESTGAIFRSIPDPSLVFEAFSSDRYPALHQQLEQWFEVVASPRMPISQSLQAGDILLRRIGETNLTHTALLSSEDIFEASALAASGLEMEAAGPGYYAEVVETGALPHCTHHSFARRISDPDGYLPYDQLILRFKSSAIETLFLDEGGSELEEATPTVSITVRNRIINPETVAGCNIELVGTTAPAGATNRGGRFTLDLTGVADGTYTLRAVHPSSTADPVDPAIATTTPRPDRIWRPFETTVTVSSGRITATASSDAVVAGRGLTIKLQPVWMASPNRSARSLAISLCVVHHTGGTQASSAINTFLSPRSTSAHYVIDTDGQIIKMVHESEQAFHAGHSHWLGRDSVNGFSVGIEIVNRSAPYTAAQMTAVVDLLNRIRTAYPDIPANQIVGHSDIATNDQRPPNRRLGRKSSDPGVHFDWATLEAARLGLTVLSGPPNPADYGGFFTNFPNERLRSGDNDARKVFGGSHRAAITTDVITELQTDLSRIGYYCPITGRFDAPTAAAVKIFQEHFFSGTRRRTDTAFRSGQVDSVTAMVIKNVR